MKEEEIYKFGQGHIICNDVTPREEFDKLKYRLEDLEKEAKDLRRLSIINSACCVIVTAFWFIFLALL